MSGQHTQGRAIVTDTCNNYVFDVLRIGNSDIKIGDEANARRLAACWNACDQLDTDHIESIAEVGVASVIVTADIHRKDCEAALRELAAARALLTELSDTEMLRHDMHVRISAFLKGQP